MNGNVNETDFDDEVYIGVWDGTAGIDDIIVIPKGQLQRVRHSSGSQQPLRHAAPHTVRG